jgi:Holliday junction resolvase RusA-like endonuclease
MEFYIKKKEFYFGPYRSKMKLLFIVTERNDYMFEFTIYGEPQGKARPRFGKNGRVYTSTSTQMAEQTVEEAYIAAGGKQFSGYICVEITAYFKIPERTSRVKKEEMLLRLIKPDKRPDIDNIVKLVLDGLGKNKLAYESDASVTSIVAKKFYSDVPRVVVRISKDNSLAEKN